MSDNTFTLIAKLNDASTKRGYPNDLYSQAAASLEQFINERKELLNTVNKLRSSIMSDIKEH